MKYIFVIQFILCIVTLISFLEAKDSFYSDENNYSSPDDLFSDRQLVGLTSDDSGSIDIEEVRDDLFSPTGLVSQLGQNFVQWFSSSLFLAFLIPFNLAGKKNRRFRSKRSQGTEGSPPWDFSLKQLSALMRAVADVADNYKRFLSTSFNE